MLWSSLVGLRAYPGPSNGLITVAAWRECVAFVEAMSVTAIPSINSRLLANLTRARHNMFLPKVLLLPFWRISLFLNLIIALARTRPLLR